jgi:hypothetical protein
MLRATSQFRASDRLLEEQIEFYEAVRPVRRRARCYTYVRLASKRIVNRPVSTCQVTYDVP